jgi:hypothetical protein
MQPDVELETWRREWQSQEEVPVDLRQRVDREIGIARRGWLMAILVTVVYVVGSVAWVLWSGRSDALELAVIVWAFTAVTWIVSLAVNRGPSQPAAKTTADFLNFSILSCQRRRNGIAAAAVLYVVFVVVMLTWEYRRLASAPDLTTYLTAGPMPLFGLITLTLAMLGVFRWRRLTRELDALRSVRDQLTR